MDKKFISLLSLCKKSGGLVAGEFSCEKSLQTDEACLIIITEDASDNTKKKFVNKSFYYETPCYIYGDRDIMSNAIGQQNRATISILDPSFAEKLQDIIKLSVTEINQEKL